MDRESLMGFIYFFVFFKNLFYTLRNWYKSGRLKSHHTTDSGYRYYSQEQLNRILGVKDTTRKVIGYCRVSSHKQKDDLDRQVENMKTYLLAQGRPFKIITDIGSGIDYKKKGLRELIKLITQNEVDKIDTTEKTEQQELVKDMIQIIIVFSCKLQGKRANKTKKMIKELMEDDTSEEI